MIRESVPSIIAYPAAGAVAVGAYCAHIPLAWMLAPLFTAAAFSLCGARLKSVDASRRFGQLCVGSAIGLNMDAQVVAELLKWLPLMAATSFISVIFSSLVAAGLARAAGIDLKTAFFASLPGGLSEMGNIGTRIGAAPEPIAIVQTLRIAIVVSCVPLTLIAFNLDDAVAPPIFNTVPYLWVLVLLGGGALCALLLGKLRLNNPWTIGAIFVGAALASSNLVSGHIPNPIFFFGQYLIGFAVGVRFRREMLRRMPRVTFCAVGSIAVFATLMALYALGMAKAFDIDFMSSALAVAPGGMAEMTAAAQALHVAVPFVVGFQVIRSIMVNGLALHYYHAFERSGALRVLERLAGK